MNKRQFPEKRKENVQENKVQSSKNDNKFNKRHPQDKRHRNEKTNKELMVKGQ